MATECNGRISGNLHCYSSMLRFSDLQGFSIQLDRFDLADSLVSFVWNAERSSNSELASLDIDSHNYGVLYMEYIALYDFKDAGEHSLGTIFSLTLISTLLEVSLKLIKQMIDDICSKDGDAVLISKSLSIRHNFHIEC